MIHLHCGGTSLLLRLDDDRLPAVLHWGAGLGELGEDDLVGAGAALATPYGDSPISSQEAVALLPQHAAGWLGRPGLVGSRDGASWSPVFDRVTHTVEPTSADGWLVCSTAGDETAQLEVRTELELTVEGLVRVRAGVQNLGPGGYQVERLEPSLPVPDHAGELLDMTGRHNHERHPVRRPFGHGSWNRESWGGRPGHDSATTLCAGVPGFGFRSGTVWGIHLAWSGNQILSAERSVTGWRLLRGAELLLPGELTLTSGESYWSPWLVGSWGEGLDELSARFHGYLRRRDRHPASPRPVVLNTWEAVHYDHDLERLLALAEQAAAVGVERFVLDDGWFLGRRDDTSGLGDWYVDPVVWPKGLHPLADRVRELGMDFGLWFEPEMVNLDSDLAREHPDWLLQTEHGPGLASRYQHVLDVAHPQAWAYLLGRISAIVEEYDVRFIKWDHNRALIDAGHGPGRRPGVHLQTVGALALMEELRDRHPRLEIESCSAGGGRLDLGVIEHADRVWVSDCMDAHERHRMVRWTNLHLPLELLGTHVGSDPDLSTGRRHTLAFRAGTALWGHFGVEWDLTQIGADELAELGRWIALYKEVRHLVSTGTVVRGDLPDPSLQLDGIISPDRRDALFRITALDSQIDWPTGRVRLPGLDPERHYDVTAQSPGDGPVNGEGVRAAVGWSGAGIRVPGRLLAEVGLQAPLLGVDELVLVRARAVDTTI